MFSFNSAPPAPQTTTNVPAATAAASAPTPAPPSSPFGCPSTAGGFGIMPPTAAAAAQPSQFGGYLLQPAAVTPSTPSAAAPLSPFGGFGGSASGFAALPPSASPTLAASSTASTDSAASTASIATSTSSGSVFGFGFGVGSSMPPQSTGIFGTPAAQESSRMFGSVPDRAFGHYDPLPTSSPVPPPTSSNSVSGVSMFVMPPPLNLPSASVQSDAPVINDPKKTKKKKNALANALVVDEEEGVVVFPSRDGIEFRYRLTLTKSDRIKIWIQDRTSKQQWESNELELDEIVPKDLAIPMMELKDYFESFKSCLLAAETGLYKGANKHELIPTGDKESKDNAVLQLELTLGIQIFSKVLTPTYKFKLHAVDLSEMDILNARIRDQDEEIKDLRTEIDALSSKISGVALGGRVSARAIANADPIYLRAETTDATSANHAMIWQQTDAGGFSLFQLFPSGAIKFSREGLYNIQVVVHHTNAYNPDHGGAFGNPWPEREAFRLEKDGRTVASSYGSTVKGTLMSSPLHHILPMQKDDELRVVYSGSGYAKKPSYIIIHMVK